MNRAISRRIKTGIVILAVIFLVFSVHIAVTLFFDSAVMKLKEADFQGARTRFELLATFGHRHAQSLLGDMYAYGLGVSRNRKTAIEWFRKAGRHNGLKDPAAAQAYSVAATYDGQGGYWVKPDPAEAEFWFQFAKQGGYVSDGDDARMRESDSNPKKTEDLK